MKSWIHWSPLQSKRIWAALKVDLPTIHDGFLDYTNLLEALNDTMKHRNGNQYLPIPIEIGKYEFINDLTTEEIKMACKYMKDLNKTG